MRLFALVAAMTLSAALPAAAQQVAQPPRVAVIVLTLDQLRQHQETYGRSALAALGHEEWGRFVFVEAAVEPDLVETCRDERLEGRLDYCVRFYLTRAELPADAPPTVVVVLDDKVFGERSERGAGELRVTCFGRGVAPTDAAVQSTWLWPDAARMHGVNDLHRDRDALAACIEAAAAERFIGLRQPDLD